MVFNYTLNKKNIGSIEKDYKLSIESIDELSQGRTNSNYLILADDLVMVMDVNFLLRLQK